MYRCTPIQNRQREGRAGQVFQSLFKTLHVSGEGPPTGDYEMPKEDALPLLLEAISWKKSFPIIGISEANRIQYYHELEALALIRKAASVDFNLTSFGQDILRHTCDLRGNIVGAIVG